MGVQISWCALLMEMADGGDPAPRCSAVLQVKTLQTHRGGLSLNHPVGIHREQIKANLS